MEFRISFPGGKKVSAELCTVKKTIMDPPEFIITTSSAAP